MPRIDEMYIGGAVLRACELHGHANAAESSGAVI
jgi:hypothetical protein